MRSVLSDGQLGALRSCYSRTPRPDAALKLRLAQHTGLSPRVVRVWFQNQRCKDKQSQDKRARRLAEELSYAVSVCECVCVFELVIVCVDVSIPHVALP